MTTDYKKQGEDFLRDTETTLEVVEAMPQKAPRWILEDGKYGFNWKVTLKNKNHSYTFDYWGSIADKELIELAQEAQARGLESSYFFELNDRMKKIGSKTNPLQYRYNTKGLIEAVNEEIKPDSYSVLACLSPLYEDSFADFCSSHGYNEDSINALQTYEVVKDQDHQLRKLFTHEEMEKLSDIS